MPIVRIRLLAFGVASIHQAEILFHQRIAQKMSRNIARVGRRRRVMNEEIMSASALGIAARGREEDRMEPGDTPRYGAGANIENHPQVTDYVPRRYRVIALYLLLALGVATLGEVLALKAATLAEWTQVVTPETIFGQVTSGLLAWVSVVTLLVSACYARLILSLRRHRVDDSRGRYRIWRWASWAGVALSLNAMIGAHSIIAVMAGHFTGMSILPGNVLWWLVPTALLGGWMMLKMILDASESRMALSCYVLAAISLIVAGIFCVWSPSWALDYQTTLTRMLPVIAHVFLMTGTLLFARYVVLDVQGLIEHQSSSQPSSHELSVTSDDEDALQQGKADDVSKGTSDHDLQTESSWVDGSEPDDNYEEQENRRLSKADRKRLRKQKQRRRAA